MDCWNANEPGAKFGPNRSLIWEVPGRFLSSSFNLAPSGGFLSEFGLEKNYRKHTNNFYFRSMYRKLA